MKTCILLLLCMFLLSGCRDSSDGVEKNKNIENANAYEFSGDELVVLISHSYLTGDRTGEDGLLLVFADGRVEAGIGNYGKILDESKLLKQELEEYLVMRKEVGELDEAQLEQLLSLVQEIDAQNGTEYVEKQWGAQVEITKLYYQFCIRWTTEEREKILVNQGNNCAGVTSRSVDINAQNALETVLEGEYMDDWYSFLNEWFGKSYLKR